MPVLGLTGGSGSGKSTVAALLQTRGAEIIDADLVAREIVCPGQPALTEIASHFGEKVMQPDGTLNRKRLGEIVFSDRRELSVLNSITHRYIIEAVRDRVKACSGWAVIDAALLFESGLDRLCDFTVSVLAEREVRLRRIMERDGLSRRAAENRLNSQAADEFYIDNSDRIIYNNREGKEELEQAVNELFDGLDGNI